MTHTAFSSESETSPLTELRFKDNLIQIINCPTIWLNGRDTLNDEIIEIDLRQLSLNILDSFNNCWFRHIKEIGNNKENDLNEYYSIIWGGGCPK